jgi:hypothetical protein
MEYAWMCEVEWYRGHPGNPGIDEMKAIKRNLET